MGVRVGVRPPPVFVVAHVGIERRLETVQHVGFVERAGEPAFAAGTIVRCDKNKRVVELTNALESWIRKVLGV